MIVVCAARIKSGFASWAGRVATEVFIYRKLIAAVPTQNCFLGKLDLPPDLSRVVRGFLVTFKTRKPPSAAFEFNGDDIKIAVVMMTAGL